MSQFNKSTLIASLFILIFVSTGFSQYENLGNATKGTAPKGTAPKPNPWFVGGMIGGSFSNYGGSFQISPLVGYKVTQDFHVGSRITYIYSNYLAALKLPKKVYVSQKT